jgi:hypothetical protein
VDALAEYPIEPRDIIGFSEGSAGVAAECGERVGCNDWRGEVLIDMFGIEEEEQFVLQNRTANVSAVLVTREGRL